MSWTDKIEGTRTQLRGLYKAIPETTRAFGGLSKAVAENGVLDLKTKEFVALGIAVSQRCEACIVLHVEALMKAGATREELGDVLAMSVQMGGGPAMMYAAKALEAWDEFSEKA
ncbi:carboxymuconolactone decarboxylase family protein [Pseudooceanicola sp. 502str34]